MSISGFLGGMQAECWRALATWEWHLPSRHHANTPGYKKRDFPFFQSSLPCGTGACTSTPGRTPFVITIASFPPLLCERRKLEMQSFVFSNMIFFGFVFCFLAILTDVFVWCSGWDPTASTWQPGNQSLRVAMVTRGGRGGEVHFIMVGCVPSWKPTEFLDRGHYEINNNKRPLASRQACELASPGKMQTGKVGVSMQPTPPWGTGRRLLPSAQMRGDECHLVSAASVEGSL